MGSVCWLELEPYHSKRQKMAAKVLLEQALRPIAAFSEVAVPHSVVEYVNVLMPAFTNKVNVASVHVHCVHHVFFLQIAQVVTDCNSLL